MLFWEIYCAGTLATAMYLLRELRKQNEIRDEPSEDWAMAATSILVAVFWLPILTVLVLAVVLVLAYDWVCFWERG
jgi:hypothetical protein